MRLEDLKGDSCLWCDAEIDLSHPYAIARIYCCRSCCQQHDAHLRKAARIEAKQGRRCAQCDVEIPISKLAGTIYCTPVCRERARGLRAQRARRLSPLMPRVIPAAKLNRHCRQCHGPIAPHKRLHALYCSRSCANQWHHKITPVDRQWYPLVCETCGIAYFGSRPTQRFCSLTCSVVFARLRTEKRRPIGCVVCGITFRRRYPSDAKITCSDACAGALRWRNRRAAIQCEAIS